MGFFSFFSKEKKETLDKGLSKTKESVFSKIARAVAGKSKVDDEVLDNLEEELREKHIERLSRQLCNPTSGVAFLDIISNLERISDHAYNLAGYVMSEQ